MKNNNESAGPGPLLWPLPSGTWRSDADGASFGLALTVLDHTASLHLSPDDLRALVLGGRSNGEPDALYPPEFTYSPVSGIALEKSVEVPSAGWVPPYGAAPLGARSARTTRGLRQANVALALTKPGQRRHNDDVDASMVVPPPGSYDFVSARFGTQRHVLLAVEPSRGGIYLYLPASMRWESLEHELSGALAVSTIDRAEWRCELVAVGNLSRLFVPTSDGLACIVPDAACLNFSVVYAGDAPTLGAPIQFGEEVWAPVCANDGPIRFVSLRFDGKPGNSVDAPVTSTVTGRLRAPLGDGSIIIWPCENGQLVLKKQANGALVATFVAWPAGLQPAVAFGSPYFSQDGLLWQLCFDPKIDTYVYLQLGVERPQRQAASGPRLCTGTYNYRFATRFRDQPWLDPEQGDDGATDTIVVPLLESSVANTVLGLRIETTAGLAVVLKSTDRIGAVLILENDDTQFPFHTLSVAEPWRLRMFVHEGLLWAYHPLAARINGWTLTA